MIDPLVVPVDGKTLDWPRRVANALKAASGQLKSVLTQIDTQATDITALQASDTAQSADITALQTDAATRLHHPFEELSGAPASPAEGQTYYDTTLHKARTWDGSAWQNFW